MAARMSSRLIFLQPVWSRRMNSPMGDSAIRSDPAYSISEYPNVSKEYVNQERMLQIRRIFITM